MDDVDIYSFGTKKPFVLPDSDSDSHESCFVRGKSLSLGPKRKKTKQSYDVSPVDQTDNNDRGLGAVGGDESDADEVICFHYDPFLLNGVLS